MKRIVFIIVVLTAITTAVSAMAMPGHEAKKTGGSTGNTGYKHEAVVDGVRSEFQIMSLESMNMKDEKGATHHIMVKLFDDATRNEIKQAVGKIKIIGPDGAEQVSTLKNYSGIFAANFTFGQTGKYGVICLLKVDGQKKLVKFWYNHHG